MRFTRSAVMVVILCGVLLFTPFEGVAADFSRVNTHPHHEVYGTWSKNIRITGDSLPYNVQTEPHIAINSKGNMVVVWKEANTNDGAGQGVGWTYSDDGGTTWGQKKDVPVSSYASDPWVIVDENDDIFYAYLTGDGDYVRRSTDGGHTWGPAVKATDTNQGLADKETIGTNRKGCIFLAYDDKGSDYTRGSTSCDKGATWSPTVPIADQPSDIGGPFITGNPSNGHVYAVFMRGTNGNYGIYFDKSTDNGKTWGTDVLISNTAALIGRWKISLPGVAIDSKGTIYVAWPGYQNGQFDILVSSSSDEGATWSAPVKINDDSGNADQWQIQGSFIIDDQDVLHAMWRDERDGVYNQYYSNSSDGGKTWSKNIKVSDQGFDISNFPRPGDYNGLAIAPNRTLYAVWADGRDDGDSYLDIYFSFMPLGTPNRPPDTPSITGPGSGVVNVSYSYNITGTDPDSDQISYTIDWGDGTNDTTQFGASGWKASVSHAWKNPGAYNVKAMSIDAKGLQSGWSIPLQVTISSPPENHPPHPPSVTGPSSGKTGVLMGYEISGSDPDSDQVKYVIDWGDGKSDTTQLGASGWKASVSHAWGSPGGYEVKAKTIDARGLESSWSPPFNVSITSGAGSPPNPPGITGPDTCPVNVSCEYTFTSTDPDNDKIMFVIDWGDNTTEDTDLIASGEQIVSAHVWQVISSFTLKAKARDSTGLESSWGSKVIRIIESDDQPPVIQHTPVKEAWSGEKIPINARITDDIGVRSATLYYRQKGTDTWRSVLMKNNGTQYTAEIPSEDVVPGVIEYYIQAEDYALNKGVSPQGGASSPYEITVKSRPALILGVDWIMLLLILLIVVVCIILALVAWRRRKRRKETAAQYSQDWYGMYPPPYQ